MDFKALFQNFLAIRPALVDTWKVLRGELMGFEWRKANGTFESVVVVMPIPAKDGQDGALSFELARPLEWRWTPDTDGALPEWPAAYTALDAREFGSEVRSAWQVASLPPPTLEAVAPPAEVEPAFPDYQRPELTADHQAAARQLAGRLTNGKSMNDIRLAVAGLLCENQRLTLEVNEHRAYRGIAQLPVFETNGRGR